MPPKMYEIWPGRLWTRGRTNSLSRADRDWIAGQGVRLVVTVCPRPDPGWEGITAYWHRPMSDGMKIHTGVEALADEIAESGLPALIHCNAGRNRSVFLAGLVLTRIAGLTGQAAAEHVQRVRPGSLANPLFAAYLRAAPAAGPPTGVSPCITGGLR